jgi:GxxExxY protein
MRYREVTERIIKAAFVVHGKLGWGFLEKVYENALAVELRQTGFAVKQQVPIPVDRIQVGEYFADLLVDDVLICEIKACESLAWEHELQLVNYLKATGTETGLLINFGRSVTVKRKFLKYRNPDHPEKSC